MCVLDVCVLDVCVLDVCVLDVCVCMCESVCVSDFVIGVTLRSYLMLHVYFFVLSAVQCTLCLYKISGLEY